MRRKTEGAVRAKRQIFITGAAGFLARHLIDLLVDDYAITGQVKPHKELADQRLEIVRCKLNDSAALHAAIPEGAIVIHCYSLSPGAHAPKETYRLENVEMTSHLLKVCEKKNVKKLIYISSTSIIGPNSTKHITEDLEPSPDNHYGWSKGEAEQLIFSYGKKTGTPTAILRLSTLYGPGMNLRSSSIRLFKLMKYPIFIQVGNGENLYEFTYIKNAAYGVKLAMEKKGMKHMLLNIADVDKVSFDTIVKSIAKHVNPDVRFVRIPVSVGRGIGIIGDIITFVSRKRFPVRSRTIRGALGGWVTDTARAQKAIGLTQPHDLDKGIGETVAWLKKKGAI